MSVKTIYTCDKCGKEQNSPNQFWRIGVVVSPDFKQPLAADYTVYANNKSMEVCRECLENFGIYTSKKTLESKPEIANITIEDLIIQLIQDCKDE